MKKYITYITYYKGDLLPPFYIGSSSEDKILNGYNGTILSKKYKEIYRKEQKENKHLFKTKILSYHETREEALKEELRLQKKHNVITNNRYFNESYAQPNGYFGRDVSGKNNPMYGKTHTKLSMDKKRQSELVINKNTGLTLKEEATIKRVKNSIKKYGNGFGNIEKCIATRKKEFIKDGNITTIDKENGKKQSITKQSKEWKETKGLEMERKRQKTLKENGSHKGYKNSQAKRINIYDSDDNLLFECHGNLKKICIENNFPYETFRLSYINNNKIYSNSSNSALSKLENNGNIKFKNWYCKEV